ncbi:hypothetical protein AX14_002683 [Amanita brunnescens Koide BX004]|nr:hypothetical protein AX14_002683 [Amanita brunnescens Koide BX004]
MQRKSAGHSLRSEMPPYHTLPYYGNMKCRLRWNTIAWASDSSYKRSVALAMIIVSSNVMHLGCRLLLCHQDATGMRDEIIRDKERDGKSEKNGRFAAIEDAKRENEDHCRTLSRQHDLLLHTGL